jgi:hypothetical protein
VQEYMGVTVLTKLSGGLEDLVAGRSRTTLTHVERQRRCSGYASPRGLVV